MKKVHRAATGLIPLLVIFAGFYIFFVAGGTLNFAFLDPERWYESYWVDPAAPVPFAQRLIYFLVWILPVALGLYAVFAALRLVFLIRGGVLFDARVSALLRHVGIGTSGSGLTDFVANLLTPTMLSWTNPGGAEPVTWYFDSEPAGLIVCGAGFYMIGWIMAEARRLADENEGFI
ncbi:MAG: hypothetical protein OXC60_15600 [Litoreibacter sp.]|nr:hypothetical protein [Litoreibacter sp.]MCY4336083.1 hypothetical protein [Litoreibacter sp.]